jgi:phosphoribosylformylglycinamidine synthase
LEKSFTSGLGFDISAPAGIRKDAFLFGEGQGRAVVTVSGDVCEALEKALSELNVPFMRLGSVRGFDVRVDGELLGDIHFFQNRYDRALQLALED